MDQFHIDNYHLITKNRFASDHGGLVFYTHKNWNYEIRECITDSLFWEEMYVDITDPIDLSNIRFTVDNIYRQRYPTLQ